MRRAFIASLYMQFFFVVIISICLLATSCSREIANETVVSIQDQSKFFREENVPQGRIVARILKLKNSDPKRTIEVSEIQMSCTCSSATMAKTKLAPGEECEYKIQGDTSGKKDYLFAVSNLLWHYTGETEINCTKIALIVKIVDILLVKPSGINFGDITDTAEIQQRSVILSRGALKDTWDSIAVEQHGVDVEPTIIKKDADTYELKIQLNPKELPIGPFYNDLAIKCYAGKNQLPHAFSLFISGRIASDIQSLPPTIYFGAVLPDKIIKQSFIVSSAERNLSIRSLKCTLPDCMKLTQLESTDHKIKIECAFNPKGLRGSSTGQILLTIDTGKALKQMTVPFIAYVQ